MNLWYRLNRHFNFTLAVMLSAVILFSLVGCSGEKEQIESAQPTNAAEMQQLEDENERLRAELETANKDLKELEQRLEELEAAASAIPSATETPQIELVAPNRSPEELLIGEWFLPKFYEKSEVDNYTVSLVFNTDGSGNQLVTYYLPAYLNADNFSTSDPTGEASYQFTWSLSEDTVHTVFGGDTVVEYTFSSEQQQLLVISENGVKPNGSPTYVRERPTIPEKYVEKNVIIKNIEAQEASRMRQFLGTWYFDLTTWTFNEDGTGIFDIPEVGGQPATKREFTYSVTGDTTETMLTINWSDTSDTVFFWPKINGGSSIMLNDAVKLTRQFDPNNCPVSMQIIQNGIGVFSGSMFYDILGGE